jgi:hypothetical protein
MLFILEYITSFSLNAGSNRNMLTYDLQAQMSLLTTEYLRFQMLALYTNQSMLRSPF